MDTRSRQRDPARGAQRGPLRPIELTEGAVLADLCVALCLVGWLLPFGAALIAVAIIPMAALAARHRLRTVLVAGIAGITASVLVAGLGLATNVAACTCVGAVVGIAIKRGWSRTRTVVSASVLIGVPAVAAILVVMTFLASLRKLALVQVTNSWKGTSNVLRRLHLTSVSHAGDDVITWLVRNWAVTATLAIVGAIAVVTWFAYGLAKPTLARLAAVTRTPLTFPPEEGVPGPVPVRLAGASYRYPGRDVDALVDIDMTIDAGEFIAVIGRNGSGKSTLGRVVAGLPVSAGAVTRPGTAGLGHHGGTAVVFQRPETQVLGVTAADDVVWGLRPDDHPDVGALLARVGLQGFERRETATLSGGELQRLALAAALARAPALLIADEATAMVDPPGREALVDLLRDVAAEGVSVVHITHRLEETAGASRVVSMAEGHIVSARAATLPPVPEPLSPIAGGEVIVRLRGVGHEYSSRTPWAHRALTDVTLELRAGEGLLVVGRNGSGKSTLAWVLAGLLAPSEGDATLDGAPLVDKVGAVGLSFQHARLQLMRHTVGADVIAASGTDRAGAHRALSRVGLDPARFFDRSVDQLSGGEQRRAALAGILASEPRVLVLDEPFAGLDTESRADLTEMLTRLRADGVTLVVVSHDRDRLGGLIDRVVELEAGRIVSSDPAPLSPALPALPGRRPRRELNLLRVVPGSSVIHRLWAGTKLLSLVTVTLALSLRPTWPMIGAMAVLVGAGIGAARIPPGAVPRLPRWFWVGIGISAALSATAGGKPEIQGVGLGALADWARVSALAVVVLSAAALVSWTTPVGEVAPSFRRLGWPLRKVHLPVDEWAAAIGLAFRCLPLLVDEVRTLAAVRRLRASHTAPSQGRRRGLRNVLEEALGLLLAALIVALRRASELASAIEARGGLGVTSADHRGPKLADVVLVAAVACVGVLVMIAT